MADVKNTGDQQEQHNCIVCCKVPKYYSIGACDHPVCFECSTRMRVLCEKKECPICRKDLKRVVFTKKRVPYEYFSTRRFQIYDKKFGISFDSERIWEEFDWLLQFRCPICDAKRKEVFFDTFMQMRQHVRKDHERFFCDLCVENLKLFSHERKCYSREELTEHRRSGDADDKSHRGHPLCKFCDERFVDNDDLYRHVRRDHFFCHFCDADEAATGTGRNIVFSDYDYLREHFMKEHFLCEEGRCKEERFVNAFRSEIDLKKHRMKEHAGQASKQQAKQMRTLELQFSVARTTNRPGGREDENRRGGREGRGGDRDARDGASGGGSGQGPGRRRLGPRNAEEEEARFRAEFHAVGANGGSPPEPEVQEEPKGVDPQNVADFPSLAASISGAPDPEPPQPTNTRHGSSYVARAVRNHKMSREEEFPTLMSTVPKTSSSSAAPVSNSVNITISRGGGGGRNGKSTATAEYSRSVTVPLSAAAKGTGTSNAPSSVARVTRISSTQNIRLESAVGRDTFVSQGGAASGGDGWSSAVSKTTTEKSRQSPAKTTAQGVTIAKNQDAFPSLGQPEKILPSQTFAAKAQMKAGNAPKGVWGTSKGQKNDGKGSKAQGADAQKPEPKQQSGPVVLSKSKPTTTDYPSLSQSSRSQKTAEAGPEDDFPSLKLVQPFQATGARRLPPPPGFSKPAKVEKKVTGNGAAPTSMLTFTNSSGEQYEMATGSSRPSTKWRYKKPSKFDSRSEELTKKIRQGALRGDVEKFNDFTAVSADFLAGLLTAREYYKKCVFYFSDDFGKIFPEFLALLPDISKQEQLVQVFHESADAGSATLEDDLFNCPICRQTLRTRDYEDHADYHGEVHNNP